jgi:hypothetical protein
MKLNGVRIAVLVLALVIAIFHAFYVRAIFFSLVIGGYFLVAAMLFLIGGLAGSLSSGRLFRTALDILRQVQISTSHWVDCWI